MLFIPINCNEDGKSDWFAIFRSNPWRKFIELLEVCYKDTNIHETADFWLQKAQNVTACHILL